MSDRQQIRLADGLLVFIIGLATFAIDSNLKLIAEAVAALADRPACTCHVERSEDP